jgi:hypothetical protein
MNAAPNFNFGQRIIAPQIAAPINTTRTALIPDRHALAAFSAAVFKNASPEGFVALRGYKDDGTEAPAIINEPITIGDPAYLDVVAERAKQAADWPQPVVFCPPVVTFLSGKNAKKENIREGVTLSVDCDSMPVAAQAVLEGILGKPTIAVASGGGWTSPDTGEVERKCHLHWRLKQPTRTPVEHDLLREARKLATELVGGDSTGISLVHPFRWPGSWHRKKQPTLAAIIDNNDTEIDLHEALALLREMSGRNETPYGQQRNTWGASEQCASKQEHVALALQVIPNVNRNWDEWNNIGLAVWGATNGSDIGFKAFAEWSAKSSKNDPTVTTERWDHITRCPPDRIGFGTLVHLARQVDSNWSAEPRVQSRNGLSLGDFQAYLPMHKYIYVPTRDLWPGVTVDSQLGWIPLVNEDGSPQMHPPTNKKNAVTKKDEEIPGKQKCMRSSDWLDKHQAVAQMTWAPGEPMLITGRLMAEGGWIEQPGVTCFNLYRAPTIKLGDPKKAQRWVDHVKKVYPTDHEHIILFLAFKSQFPGSKINHCLVLGGNPGVGKDTLLEPAVQAVGPWNVGEASPETLTGRFNGFLKSVLLRISEARDTGEVSKFQLYERMKVINASPPFTLVVDEKNLKEHRIQNVVAPILTTNYRTDGLYLPADDRRHYVAWSDATRADFDSEPGKNDASAYFTSLWNWYQEEGGFEDVAAYLMDLDVSGFNPKAPPFKTPAFWAIVDAGRSSEESEIADLLDKMSNPPAVTIHGLAAEADDDLESFLKDRKNRKATSHKLAAVGYEQIRNDVADDGLWRVKVSTLTGVEAKRMAIYALTTLPVPDRMKAAKRLADGDHWSHTRWWPAVELAELAAARDAEVEMRAS